MRVWPAVLVAALVGAGCASQSGSSTSAGPSSQGGSGPAPAVASGGSSGTATGGTTGSASGGTPGTGGATPTGTGGTTASGGTTGTGGGGGAPAGSGGTAGAPATSDAAPDQTASAPPMMGGKALLVTGTIPIVGTDVQFEAAFKARGLEVEIVQDRDATPMHAQGKRIIMLSYGMKSTEFKAEAFTDVPVPIIVTEQNLLPRLKMSSAHGFTGKMTKITMISDHELAGGFPKGDLEVYSPSQEFFWGTPSAAGIRIAHLLGQPEKVTYFAYEKGAMMDGAMAPAKRVQFFHATHSPDPIDKNLYLNANGLKLLGVTIDWCLK
jgi:hypothetical protein